jgi:hypothetical protein
MILSSVLVLICKFRVCGTPIVINIGDETNATGKRKVRIILVKAT